MSMSPTVEDSEVPAGGVDAGKPAPAPAAAPAALAAPAAPAGATEELREAVLRELEAMQFEAEADSAKDVAYARKQGFHLAEEAAKCAFRASKAEAQAASLMQQAAKFRLHSATLTRKVVQQRALVASKEAAAAAAREHAARQPVKEAHQRKAAGMADKLAQIPPKQRVGSDGRSANAAKAAKAGGESDPELELWAGAFWTDLYCVATRMLAKEEEREREREHTHERKHEAVATAHEPAQIPLDERSAASDGRTAEAASADESEHDMDEPVVWADLCEVPDSPKVALRSPEAPLAAEESPGAPCSAASAASLTMTASSDSPAWSASPGSPTSSASSASPDSPTSPALPSALASPARLAQRAAGATSPPANNNKSGSDERTDASETEAGAGGNPEAAGPAGPAGLATPGGNEHKKGRRRPKGGR